MCRCVIEEPEETDVSRGEAALARAGRVGANNPINYVGITRVLTAANLSMPIPSRGTLRSLVKRRGDQAAV